MDYFDVRYCKPSELKNVLNSLVYDGYDVDSYTLNKGANGVFIVVGKKEVTKVEFEELVKTE